MYVYTIKKEGWHHLGLIMYLLDTSWVATSNTHHSCWQQPRH